MEKLKLPGDGSVSCHHPYQKRGEVYMGTNKHCCLLWGNRFTAYISRVHSEAMAEPPPTHREAPPTVRFSLSIS